MKRWMLVVAIIGAGLVSFGNGPAGAAQATRSTPAVSGPGYWLVGGDGGVFSFNAPFLGRGSDPGQCGSTQASHAPFVCFDGIGATPDGGGYTLVNPLSYMSPSNGVVDASPQFGNASGAATCTVHFSGPDPNAVEIWRGIASTPTGQGFWLVGFQGGIATCGDASFYGDSIRGLSDAARIGIAATPGGKGYWEAAADGGVFSFGDAQFYGSMGGRSINQPIVGIAATPDGKGYWLVASDGGVFAFGDATFNGSMGSRPLDAPMVGIAADPDGSGYWTTATDGGVFAFGGAPFEGSMGGRPLNFPVVGIAARG